MSLVCDLLMAQNLINHGEHSTIMQVMLLIASNRQAVKWEGILIKRYPDNYYNWIKYAASSFGSGQYMASHCLKKLRCFLMRIVLDVMLSQGLSVSAGKEWEDGAGMQNVVMIENTEWPENLVKAWWGCDLAWKTIWQLLQQNRAMPRRMVFSIASSNIIKTYFDSIFWFVLAL